MIDHTSIRIKNFKLSTHFYDEIFACLGYERIMTFDNHAAGYGFNGKPYFWVVQVDEELPQERAVHFAFRSPDRKSIDEWFKKAIELGGIDNGKPGLRTHYHPNYYAAFIIDPDGWRIEAVCHTPE